MRSSWETALWTLSVKYFYPHAISKFFNFPIWVGNKTKAHLNVSYKVRVLFSLVAQWVHNTHSSFVRKKTADSIRAKNTVQVWLQWHNLHSSCGTGGQRGFWTACSQLASASLDLARNLSARKDSELPDITFLVLTLWGTVTGSQAKVQKTQ